jgi:hypothetical protein
MEMNKSLSYNEAVQIISRSIDNNTIKDACHAASILAILFNNPIGCILQDIIEERRKIKE